VDIATEALQLEVKKETQTQSAHQVQGMAEELMYAPI
jgi:hypothetical protein